MVIDKKEALDQISQLVASCQRCRLYQTANSPVPGTGNPEALVFFVGEAPGFNEDQQGVPFCGRAGKLLDFFLELAFLNRKEVFIANMLRHRPPNNRDPLEEEMVACQPFLDRQIEIVSPRVIVTLGRFSLEKFLPGAQISQVHGQPRFVQFKGREKIVFPMYHPAASLRSGRIRVLEEEDFKKLGQFLLKLTENQENKQKDSPKSNQNKTEKQMKLI